MPIYDAVGTIVESSTEKMLHELLLLLSAHDSSVFKPWPPSPASPETVVLDSTFTNVHPSERAALNALAHLAFLHKTLRDSTSRLISSHSSIVVRAVLSAVRDKAHGFEDTVEKIERMILARDDSVVGAYDIVPLARLTTLLGEWDRIIEYMCGFVLETTNESTGAQVLDRLHRHENTGYPDIAEVVAKLIAAGEEAWLRQVSSWVLYGCIPQLGHSDFFIHPSDDPNISPLDENAFIIDWSLWPAHLPRETGSSIFFVGRALARIQTQSSLRQLATQEILKCHLDYLNSLDFPLAPNVFTRAITSIRLSLSSSILSNLLPLDTIIRLVKRFRQDFLLGHGSLMITLLSVTDEYRVRRTERDGGTIKEAEVNNLLTKAWSIISRVESVRDEEDDPERQAYERSLKLSLKSTEKPADGTGLIMFDEFLLGQRVQLKYEISWPLDLFLSKTDIAEYDRIFNFLLAVKRSQGRLTSLWPGRKYSHVRRVTWATIKYALFFIDSLWNYFQVSDFETELIPGDGY